jgi:ribosome-associated protein
MTASPEARETALLAAQAAADKLATNVSIVDVSDRLAITDAFVLASAPNERQVQAIVDEVEDRLRRHGMKPVRREGVAEARWVLLDFIDVVVHVQHAEERAYYALERLWKDCPAIPFVDRAAPPAGSADTAGAPGADGAAGADGADGGGIPASSRETLSADDVDPASADPTPLAPEPAVDDHRAVDGPGGAPAAETTDP